MVDTIKSGQGLCNEELSYLLCRQAGDRILEMKKWKTDWANKNGRIIQVMAPGHQVKRCCYVDFLNTGPAVSRTLRGEVVKRPRVKRLSGLLILDLCVDFGRVLGAIALNVETGEFLAIDSKSVVWLRWINPLI